MHFNRQTDERFWMLKVDVDEDGARRVPHILKGAVVSAKAKFLINRDGLYIPCDYRECWIKDDAGDENWDQYVPDRALRAMVPWELEIVDSFPATSAWGTDPSEELRYILRDLMINTYCDAEYVWYNGTREAVGKSRWFGFCRRYYEHEFLMFRYRCVEDSIGKVVHLANRR